MEALDVVGHVSPRATLATKTADCVTTPPPPAGNVVKIDGTVNASSLNQKIAAAPAGAVTVMPADGKATFTVSDDIRLARDNVTFRNGSFKNIVADGKGNGFVFDSCTVHAWGLRNVRDWTIKNCNQVFNGQLWNSPEFGPLGGSCMYSCKNWKILDTIHSGHYDAAGSPQHCEAWYIAGGNDGGLIKGCTFDNGGNTAHLFWTWWGGSQTDAATWPKNICVTQTKFTRCHNPSFHTNLRAELQNTPLNNHLDVASCTFDTAARFPMGNEQGEFKGWYGPCG